VELNGSGVFDEVNAAHLSQADTSHWWFRGKAQLVSELLRRWAPSTGWVVDVGAGSGGVTSMLDVEFHDRLALEGSAVLVEVAARRGLRTGCSDVVSLPLRSGSAAAVCLLDVIEHLLHPVEALAEARRLVGTTGVVIVTVPAHAWLWSQADEVLGHQRRYTRSALRVHLVAAGLEPLWLSHVFSWCVPPVWAARKLKPSSDAELGIDRTSRTVDQLARALNSTERRLLSKATLPFGTSIAAVASAS
jgi:SAM-dependent methyltransferase